MRQLPPPILVRILAAAALLVTTVPAGAQPTAQAVKAAFLPKFARYVTWPPSAMPQANAPLALCVFGRDSLGSLLDRASQGQSLDQHPIAVRRVSSIDAAGDCQILFVGGGQNLGAILAHFRGRPVLTVTDQARENERGMINFVLKDGRVRFFIDDAAAARSNLVIDARLLGIALGVRQRSQ